MFACSKNLNGILLYAMLGALPTATFEQTVNFNLLHSLELDQYLLLNKLLLLLTLDRHIYNNKIYFK